MKGQPNGKAVQDRQFRQLWDTYSTVVKQGESYADVTSSTTILTLVARIEHTIAASLAGTVNSIVKDYTDVYVYPAETIHTTVLYLSPYIGAPTTNMDAVEALYKRLAMAVNHFEPINYEICGLGIFPTGIFGQVYVRELSSLVDLRKRISSILSATAWNEAEAGRFERSIKWHLFFANVARFLQPVEGHIVQAVRPFRNHCFGRGVLQQLELVLTDKLLSEAGTRVVARLGGYPKET